MQAAFALAVERSAHNDPLLENRAALFALAILLGHSDLEPFVGELLDPEQKIQARQMIGTVALRGRQDWARHFLVSAALVRAVAQVELLFTFVTAVWILREQITFKHILGAALIIGGILLLI